MADAAVAEPAGEGGGTSRERRWPGDVVVAAHARLHFGMLDLAGVRGRRFGGIGAGVMMPSLLLSARVARTLGVTVEDDARESTGGGSSAGGSSEAVDGAARAAVERICAHFGIADRAHITFQRVIPAHRGLGSGTQTALATARALAELFDLPRDAVALSRIVGRAQRSAIGTYVFAHGGFVVEGGRGLELDRVAPLLVARPMPAEWRCVLALPPGRPGMSGAAESAAFAALPAPPSGEAERVAHLVLMAMLPALAEADLPTFGAALSEIQQINGRWFAPAQGGSYAPGASAAIVERLTQWGATGVGQSSWGPAVYALAGDPEASASLARRLRSAFPDTTVFDTAFA